MDFSPNNDKVIAYFQPIFCVNSNSIYSYEVLGRFIGNQGQISSLGDFFSDASAPSEDVLRVDRMVRRYAMEKYAEEKRSEYLFINIRLAWLMDYVNKLDELPTLRLAKEFGIDPRKLVIEITEEEFNVSEDYISVVKYYKEAGCRIALDDYGKNASDIDRLALLWPDIIKINKDYIHKSVKSHHYREYLKFLSAFAESVGIDVLYEGVETQEQFDICRSLSGRFYQGFFFSQPLSDFASR